MYYYRVSYHIYVSLHHKHKQTFLEDRILLNILFLLDMFGVL